MELFDYLQTIRKRIWLIVWLIVFSCTASGILFTQLNHPQYQALSKIVVNKTNAADSKLGVDPSSVSANIMLVNTYKQLITSEPILQDVLAQNTQLHLTIGQLEKLIKVSSFVSSQVVTIAVEDKSYERAARIANAVARVFKDDLFKIMNMDNITILSEASPNATTEPIQTSFWLVLIVSFIVSATASILLAFLVDYFDRTLYSEEDVERVLGLFPLVTISRMKQKTMSSVRSHATTKKVGEPKHVNLSQ
jgi:capsular polysaccharide biosynthesis protein